MVNVVVVGAQWGDEGKGKIVDLLMGDFDATVRFQGGANAGHTVVVTDDLGIKREYKLHLVPSGVAYHKLSVIGPGVTVDPMVLYAEVLDLMQNGLPRVLDNIILCDDAILSLPVHRVLDCTKEAHKALIQGKNIGTTGRGIGPSYSDMVARDGFRIMDLFDKTLEAKLEDFCDERSALLQFHMKGHEKELAQIIEKLNKSFTDEKTYGKIMDILPKEVYDFNNFVDTKTLTFNKNEILKTMATIRDAILSQEKTNSRIECKHSWKTFYELERKKLKLIFETAQGALLDNYSGTFDNVTSSFTRSGGVMVYTPFSWRDINEVVGIVKAYTTRVGSGPFPTEQDNKEGEKLRDIGVEFGATTGRPRRCGWIDQPLLQYSARINGITQVAVTKLDVLDTFEKIPVCVGYETMNGKKIHFSELRVNDDRFMRIVKPVYKEFDGWMQTTTGCRSYDELPDNAKEYISRAIMTPIKMENLGAELRLVSVGPKREQTIYR